MMKAKKVFLTGTVMSLAVGGIASVADRSKPNVIFIMADDMGYGDLGCYNKDSKIPTPNMDRLAEEGARFTDAHSPSAVCSPTRYGLMTGRYAWRTRLKTFVLTNFDQDLIELGRMTLPRLFKDNGYQTACIGKWHLGMGWSMKDGSTIPLNQWAVQKFTDYGRKIDFTKEITGGPLDAGFDYFFGGTGNFQAPPYCFIENRHTVGSPDIEKKELDFSPKFLGPMVPGPMVNGWRDDLVGAELTRKVEDVIANYAKKPQPFFVYMPLCAPHEPCVPPEFAQGKSAAGPRGDMVFEIDATVGRIMQELKDLGIEKNTILIVTSDNGATHAAYQAGVTYESQCGHNPSGPWKGYKAQIWEGGHRIPFIIRWPDEIKAGSVNSSPLVLSDMLATFAAFFRQALPDKAGEDSHNVLPVLLGQKEDDASGRLMVFHSVYGQFAIRQGRWKLVMPNPPLASPNEKRMNWGMPGGSPQLFDLSADPKETRDVSSEHPELVQSLEKQLEQIKASGASANLP